jgi:hypothetical protein
MHRWTTNAIHATDAEAGILTPPHAVKVTEHLAFHRLVLDSADANRVAWEEGATLMLRKKRIHETVSQMQAFKIKVCSAD